MKSNIALIGFMGSGKTSVGRELSTSCDLNFLDTDEFIEDMSVLPIKTIFDIYGESCFRELEILTCNYLSYTNSTVIATGGGFITSQQNIYKLQQNSILIYLQKSPIYIYENIKNNISLPMLSQCPTIEQISNLLSTRLHLYTKYADIIIETDNLSVAEITKIIEYKIKAGDIFEQDSHNKWC